MTRSYRNKLYVAFDGDTDMKHYRLLEAWRENNNIDFNFYNAHDLNLARDTSQIESIRSQLRERLNNSKAFLLLVGEKTKSNRKFIPWEIEAASRRGLPIIVANIGGSRRYDANRCPATLDGGRGAIHVAPPPTRPASRGNRVSDHRAGNSVVGGDFGGPEKGSAVRLLSGVLCARIGATLLGGPPGYR